jgi:hypothetical protein
MVKIRKKLEKVCIFFHYGHGAWSMEKTLNLPYALCPMPIIRDFPCNSVVNAFLCALSALCVKKKAGTEARPTNWFLRLERLQRFQRL